VLRFWLAVLAGLLLVCTPALQSPAPVYAATIEVSNGNDSGAGSLREAIANAAPGDTIIFATSVTTITLTSGQLTISDDLNIDGGAGVAVERDATSSDFRIFEITAGTVTFTNLAIRNGLAPVEEHGGGIRNAGTLTLSGSIVGDNRSGNGDGFGRKGGDGGGIYNGGTLTVTNSAIQANQAGAGDVGGSGTGGAGGDGGGIYNSGMLTLNGSMLESNQAGTGGRGGGLAGTGGAGGAGGGIFNAEGASLTVSDSSFRNNRGGDGNKGSGLANGGTGGAGGGISNSGTLTITSSILDQN